MGIDDYYEHKNKYRRVDYHLEREFYPEHGYSPRHSGGRGMEHYGYYIVSKIWSNRKLRLLFIGVILILFIIVIFLLIALIPFLIKIVDYITQTGLKGITESVIALIEKLWSGSGS